MEKNVNNSTKPQHDAKLLVLRCSYSVKKAENPERICIGCALRVGLFGCVNRKACPDDGTGLNLYYEGSTLE
jgi:hypothetical protein